MQRNEIEKFSLESSVFFVLLALSALLFFYSQEFMSIKREVLRTTLSSACFYYR